MRRQTFPKKIDGELVDRDGDPVYCDNPFCEFPAVEVVSVSENKLADSRRNYCASCLAVYEVGVQHGRLVEAASHAGKKRRRR